MMIYSFVIIIVNPPVVQAQPIVQEPEQPRSIAPDPGLTYRCPHCGWWNAYDTMTAFKIGSKAHLRRCPKR